MNKELSVQERNEIVIKALNNGFYFIEHNHIYWNSNQFVFVGNTYGGSFIRPKTIDTNTHEFNWDRDFNVQIHDYGKTWALTKEELHLCESCELYNSLGCPYCGTTYNEECDEWRENE